MKSESYVGYYKNKLFVMGTSTFLLIIFLVIIAIIYLIPTKKTNFFKIYKKNDKAAQSLREFHKKPTKLVVVDNIKWEYLSAGHGEKTILFIHGMGGDYELWWQQVIDFEKDFKVITYSLPEKVDNLNEALKGIKAILAKENVDKFYAVGTSMGGYIAQYLVKMIPNRVEKVVFGNTFPPNDDIKRENMTKSKIVPWLPEIILDKFREKSLNNELLPAAQNDSLLAAFLPSLPFTKKEFINRYKVVIDYFAVNPYKDEIKRIQKLIIESDNDPLINPKLRKKLKEFYPDAQVYTFHNEGHFPYINAAKEYNKVVKIFLHKKMK